MAIAIVARCWTDANMAIIILPHGEL
jgi:hypothetical protein